MLILCVTIFRRFFTLLPYVLAILFLFVDFFFKQIYANCKTFFRQSLFDSVPYEIIFSCFIRPVIAFD